MELISDRPCAVLRDYAHTPDALERALRTLRPLTPGRIILVFGCGGDRDRGKRPIMGQLAAELSDLPVVTSDNPRTENPDAIIDDVERGMGSAPRLRVADRRRRSPPRSARRGRAIPCCSRGRATRPPGHRHEKQPFDEREIVLAALGTA
jgi:UDP-N-acetylmuramoyl-L-alanyl-D-glutamate--2,6-diaminopimelate ligase